MAKQYQLDFEEEEVNELLLAIHSAFAPPKFAYWLNRELETAFVRAPEELRDSLTDIHFPLFSYCRNEEEIWYIIANKTYQVVGKDLFGNVEKLQLLVPTLPKVDYFLRISNYDPEEDYLSILQAIQWIEAIYESPILTEEGLSPKERKKITEIKTKLIF